MPFYYLTLFLIPFTTHPLLGYNFHGVTPVKVAGGAAVLCAILSMNDSQTRVYFPSRSKKYFWLLVAYFCLSMTANGFDIGSDRIFWLVSILMFYFTTLTLVNTRRRLLVSCVVLLITMDISSAYMLRHCLQYGMGNANYRPGGTFGDSNYYSASALAVLPIAYYLARQSTSKLLCWFGLGSLGTILMGLVLGQSRGGMLGLAAVVLMVTYQSRARVRTIASLGVVLTLFLAFSPVNPIMRFLEPGHGDKGSTDAHIALIHSAVNMIGDNPLFGVGMGRFKSHSMAYSDDLPRALMAHNCYLELAADNGIPALILFLLMCLAARKDVTNAKRLHEQDVVTNGILIGMRTGMVGFLAAAIFISAEYEKMFWVVCFLAMATSRIEPKIEHEEDLDDWEPASEEEAGPLAEPGLTLSHT